jgi:general secretion pathway protein D
VILRDAATESSITGSKYNYIRGEQLRMREQSEGLLPPEARPVLPELQAIPGPGEAATIPAPQPDPTARRERRGD